LVVLLSQLQSLIMVGEQVKLPELQLSIPSTSTAIITHMNSAQQFFVQEKKTEPLVKMINLWGAQAEGMVREPLVVDELEIGQPYVVKSPIDGQWYRMRLEKIDDTKKMVRLFNLDFGDVMELRFEDVARRLMTMEARMGTYPPLARLCFWEHKIASIMSAELTNMVNTHTPIQVRYLKQSDNKGAFVISLPDYEKDNIGLVEQKPKVDTPLSTPVTLDDGACGDGATNCVPEQKGIDAVDAKVEVILEPKVEELKPSEIREELPKPDAPLYRAPPRRDPNGPNPFALRDKKVSSSGDDTAKVFKELVQKANVEGNPQPKEATNKTVDGFGSGDGADLVEQIGIARGVLETKSSVVGKTEVQNNEDTIDKTSTMSEIGNCRRGDNEERMNKLFTMNMKEISEPVEASALAAVEKKTPVTGKVEKDLIRKVLLNDAEFLEKLVDIAVDRVVALRPPGLFG
jgi:hypothetical protein